MGLDRTQTLERTPEIKLGRDPEKSKQIDQVPISLVRKYLALFGIYVWLLSL